MIDRVYDGERLLALIIPSDYRSEGIEFFTPPEFSQQLGYMRRERGYRIQPHLHKPVPRQVEFTKEVLFIRRGSVRVDFFDESKVYVDSRVLRAGDVILLAYGGHGFEMLEDCEIVEAKQGPYAADDDKERFDAAPRK